MFVTSIKVMVSVPRQMLERIDAAARAERVSRSEFLRRAVTYYLSSKQRTNS